LRGGHAVATSHEEVVVDADRVRTGEPGEQLAQQRLELVGGTRAAARDGRGDRSASRAAVSIFPFPVSGSSASGTSTFGTM
jgi:hypothetical protein